MSNGRITEVGSYNQLMDKDGAFAELLHNYGTNEGNEEKEKTFEDIAGTFHEFICCKLLPTVTKLFTIHVHVMLLF